MSTGYCKIRRTSHASADSNAICPHNRSDHRMPLRLIAIACLEQCLVDVKMRPFHDAVCARVISRDSNVANVVSLAQIIKGFNESGAVVRDDVRKTAPSAKDIVKNPIADGLCGLCAKNAIFGIVRERAAALDQVFEAARFRKMHRIHIHLCK